MARGRAGLLGARSLLLALLLPAVAWLDVTLLASPMEIVALPPGDRSPGPDRAAPELADAQSGQRPLGDLREISERNLFAAGRRPVAFAVPAAEPDGPGGGAAIRLTGIMLRPGKASALLRVDGEAAATWIAAGGRVADWSVSEIGPAGVVLRAGARELFVGLYPTPRLAPETAEPPAP